MNNLKSPPPYRRESPWHPTTPTQCPVGATLLSIPLSWPPSLHPLRRRQLPPTWVVPLADTLVRELHRYYGAIRLPTIVHHRRTSGDFPMRPTAPCRAGGGGISRFPSKVRMNMHGVSDRAGPCRNLRERSDQRRLPHSPTRSAPRRKLLSRLNTQPAHTPVNASQPWLPTTAHDSGTLWLATPSTFKTFTLTPCRF